MSQTPPLSVVMSVRNVARYVAQAIDSVLSQTFRDYEFIIIDDGSKDSTPGILADYAGRDKRIKILRGPARGLSAALNLGIAHVQAPLVARMDGDDICLPTRLEKQVAFLNANHDHVMVGSRCVLIDPDGCPIHEKPGIPLEHDKIDAMLMRMEWPLVHPAIMMRTDAFAKTGGYLERYKTVEDHDVFLKLAELGKLANLDEILFRYRQHFQSTVYTTAEAQVRNLVEIVTAACARRGVEVPPGIVERPPERITSLQHRINWAWWALLAGNTYTARRHALAALKSNPFLGNHWRLMLCTIRGRRS